MFDGVGDGFAGGDEYVHHLIWCSSSLEPVAQSGASGCEMAGICGERQLQRRGMTVEQNHNIVLITVTRREIGT